MRVVLLEPSRVGLKVMTTLLEAHGHEVLPFTDGGAALACVKTDQAVDLIVTSFETPTVSGLELCWEARLLANCHRPLYVIAMSSSFDKDRVVEALDSGADDFISKPPNGHELLARLRAAERLTTAQRELIRLATIDPLTGLLNRRAFLEQAGDACSRNPVGCIMFDIDFFKRINDGHGHDAGDEVIRQVADAAKAPGRIVGRLGGEEFSVVVEGASLRDSHRLAERLRATVEAISIDFSGHRLGATISLGVSASHQGDNIGRLLKHADVALYAAKTGGRNRVVSAGVGAGEPRPECANDTALEMAIAL